MKKKSYLGFISLLLLLIAGCDSNRIFEEYQEIPDAVWNRNNKIKFPIEISDTTSVCNIYINVRNSADYPYRNLYLFVNTVHAGKAKRDTFECILADEKGKWLGSGLGDLFDNQILFKKNVRFTSKGLYEFELEQAMRIENLPLIADVGIRIEKSK